jgi:hypothetical protein
MRSKLVKSLKHAGAIPVENLVHPGTPDINYIDGWIECKWLKAWPNKADTIVQVSRFSKGQRWWHINRRMLGGDTWFILQVNREWLLFDGAKAALYVGRAPRAELYNIACFVSKDGLTLKFVDSILSIDLPRFVMTPKDWNRLKNP